MLEQQQRRKRQAQAAAIVRAAALANTNMGIEPEHFLQVLRARGVILDDEDEASGVYEDADESEDEEPAKLEFLPVKTRCPHCRSRVITVTTDESSPTTYLLAFVVFYLLGLYALILLPVIWPILKDVFHHCPNCLVVIGVKSNMSCPDPRKEVMSFKFGSCACVLMRKYVMLIASIIGFLTVYMHFALAVTPPPVLRTPSAHLTWEDFWVDCAAKAQSVNPVHSHVAFEKKYKDKTVTWTGKVNTYRMGTRIPFIGAEPMMLVEMDPPSTAPSHADLAVDIAPSVKERPRAGAYVQFVATITELGRRDLPTRLQAWEVKILDALPPIVHAELANRTGDHRWHHHETERDVDMQHVIEDVVKLGKSVHVPQGKGSHAAHHPYERDASGITAKLKEAADRLIPSVAKSGKGNGKDVAPDFDEEIKRLAAHGKAHPKDAATAATEATKMMGMKMSHTVDQSKAAANETQRSARVNVTSKLDDAASQARSLVNKSAAGNVSSPSLVT
jgi:hypothetical protein